VAPKSPNSLLDRDLQDIRTRRSWRFGTECAGINRHIVGDGRALRKRRSDSIPASSLACDLVRDHSEA
jgi:hypothetical protein